MARLPVGEVTFCFTDIEGSTRLARRLGDGWLAVLEQHNTLLRAVWASHGGVEVKTEGDAFFVAFANAGDAVAAAVEAQLALSTAAWPASGEVRVRVGLHSGVATVAEGDYVGFEVHKAARVAAAAHGGQVLVSGRTRELAEEGLPSTITLRPLGSYALKDFEDGVELWRVDHADLAAGPAPNARPVEAHNLPLVQTLFVGRDVERVEVAKLCEQPGLVTVVGPGGAGKTRLAIEVGRAAAAERGHGVWAVLLAGEPAGSDVTQPLARVLAVADVPGVSLLDAVCAALRDQDRLVVLDNCEHVVGSAAAVVERLLATCPNLSVLVTTRQPLGIAGERVWRIPALDLPAAGPATAAAVRETDAGRLFVDRAVSANPQFALTEATAPSVAAICRAVDGLPLAIELAAATTRSVPLETLATRLEAASMPLRATGPVPTARQSSMDALIGWSYDLLDDETRRAVFRRLSVFRGGWTLEAAEAVCADGGVDAAEVILALSDLVDRSLVLLDAGGRYRMLVLIRAFAERLMHENGESDVVEERHLAHFRGRAAEIAARGEGVGSMAATEADFDNLRVAFDRALARSEPDAALDLVLSFGALLLHRGHWRELDAAFERLERSAAPATAPAVRALINRCQLARIRGDLGSAEALAVAALRNGNELGDRELIAGCAAELGQVQVANGNPTAALATATVHDADDLPPLRRSRLLDVRGLALADLGRLAEAVVCRLEAADQLEAGGDEFRAVMARLSVAEPLYREGRRDEALAAVRAALHIADVADVPRNRAYAIYTVARLNWRARPDPQLQAELRKLADVPRALDEAIDIAANLGDVTIEFGCRAERATACVLERDMGAAMEDLRWLAAHRDEVPLEPAKSALVEVAAAVLADGGDPLAPALARTALDHDPDPWFEELLREMAGDTAVFPSMDDAVGAAAARILGDG